MANIITLIKNSRHFVSEKLWHIRLDKVDKRQGFLLRQLRIFSLAVQGFNQDKCLTKATALTFLYFIFYRSYSRFGICYLKRIWFRKRFAGTDL